MGVQVSHPGGEFLKIARHFFWQRIFGSYDHDEAVARLFQNPRFGEHFEHSAEEALVFLGDLQALPQVFGIHGLARLALPTQLFQGRECAGPGPPFQIREQSVPAFGIDACIYQIVGEQL